MHRVNVIQFLVAVIPTASVDIEDYGQDGIGGGFIEIDVGKAHLIACASVIYIGYFGDVLRRGLQGKAFCVFFADAVPKCGN